MESKYLFTHFKTLKDLHCKQHLQNLQICPFPAIYISNIPNFSLGETLVPIYLGAKIQTPVRALLLTPSYTTDRSVAPVKIYRHLIPLFGKKLHISGTKINGQILNKNVNK
jgi:hypothetical protein